MADKEIKQIGEFLPVDEDGFVINTASQEKIQGEWKPVVDEVINYYQNQLKDDLVAVYVRGSVAQGRAIKSVSDIDNKAITHSSDGNLRNKDAFRKTVQEKYPFVDGVELATLSYTALKKPRARALWKTQGVCVYGEDVLKEFSHLRIGKNLAMHAPWVKKSMENAWKGIKQNSNDSERIEKICKTVMKRVVRSGFEIVMERSGKYTRDLYLSWKEFSKYYPEKSDDMRDALELAIFPTDNPEEIREVLDVIEEWLVNEVENVYPDLLKD